MSYLDTVIHSFGGLTAFASALGRKPQMVSNWRARQVPAAHVIQVCEIACWKVTPHQLRPDLYPNATDALPVGISPSGD